MVLLTTTPTILHAVSSLPPSSSSYLSDTSLPSSLDQPIKHTTLITLSRCLPKSQGYTLNTLLRGTKPYVAPPLPAPPQTEEYKVLMARLRAEQERKNYKAMMAKQEEESLQALSGKMHDAETEQEEDSDNISPSVALNILLSVVMCALATFYWTKWWPNDAVRVLFALGTGLLVAVAEVTVYAAYLRKVNEARRKERRKREKKEVIGQFTGPDGIDAWGTRLAVDDSGKVEIEKTEEIWGKGVNGGMRRRVRDKWELEQERERLKK